VTASFVDERGELRPGHPAVAPVERLIRDCADRPERLVAALARHGVPAAAVASMAARLAPAAVATEEWRAAVQRTRAKGERLQAVAALTEFALAPVADRVALPSSAFGFAWSSDVDVLVPAEALAAAQERLRAAGFLDVEPLLARLGRADPDVRRFGAVAEGEVLGSVELCLRLHDFGPPAGGAVARASAPAGGGVRRLTAADGSRRRCAKVASRRRVILRDVLELAALRETAGALPRRWEVAIAARRCARLASRMLEGGGEAPSGRAWPAPTTGWVRARVDHTRKRLVRGLRPRRLLVAYTGIDGSGKSTQAATMVALLGRVSIPATAVWTRVGFGGSPLIAAAARIGQRLLPAGSHSAQRARATAAEPAGPVPLTRRGPLGWGWSMAVVIDYLVRAGLAVRGAPGTVVVLDRALTDALVDLEQGFGGTLDLRPHRRLLERFAPKPDVIFHLRLTGAAAHARKDDLFAAEVLERYAARFDAMLAGRDGVVVLDAETDPDQLALAALRTVAAR